MSEEINLVKFIGAKLLLLSVVLAVVVTTIEPTRAQTLTTLHSFAGGKTDGGNPDAGLVRDASGNLYGTTVNGGSSGNGTIFKVSASGKETVLHSFAGSPDGSEPFGGVLVRDGKGNLYGASFWGGPYCGGTVYEVAKKGGETVLFSFGSANGFEDGQSSPSVIRDAHGNLYGATNFGGTYGFGNIFELTPFGTETVIYNFQGGYSDGSYPEGPLLRESSGNLYGTAFEGGGVGCDNYFGCGTVFEVTPSGKETILHRFSGAPSDGQFPGAGLVRDAKGNFYGTTTSGGTFNGTVFMLTKHGTETILHNFLGGTEDGQAPGGGLIRDKQGNFYGTTVGGGGSGNGGFGWGTIYKMSADGSVTILYRFSGGNDGGYPLGDLVMDEQGNLYGTTAYGGVGTGSGCWSTGSGCGTVFRLTP